VLVSPGQVLECNRLRREVLEVQLPEGIVRWRRPGKKQPIRACSLRAWRRWAAKAAVVHDAALGDSKEPRVIDAKPAGDNHQVLTVLGGRKSYRRTPCSNCPWRVDAVGEFPAQAFRHSAATAYDMSDRTFACHQSGAKRPAICAGFLLRGAEHNLTVRLMRLRGELVNDVTSAGLQLHENYRAMAEANGVEPDDPVLQACRE